MNNHRPGAVDNENQGQPPVLEEEPFDPEKLPTKIPLVKTVDPNGTLQTLVYHAEGVYSLRMVLIDQAKKSMKELEKCDIN